MAEAAATCVLVRTRNASPAVLAFAAELEALSGHPTALILDSRGGPVEASARTVIELSKARCNALQLFCPSDFAWRCGDYGFYLARQRFPDIEHFWMVETDVRFAGQDAGEFFRFFDRQGDIDLLAAALSPSDGSWFWHAHALARDVRPFRCLFPVTRISRRAIDAMLARRLAHSRQWRRRIVWPNDEVLVGTTLMNGGFQCRDFNDFGRAFYTPATFYYGRPIDGDHFQSASSSVELIHPILFGEEYAAKMALAQTPAAPVPWFEERLRWMAFKTNARCRW